jgi:hypothetical protein
MTDTPDEGTPAVTDDPAPRVAEKKRGFARRHWLGLTASTIVLLPAAVFAAWATATLAYSYSDGARTGYNQKLSRKGWLCKTWEGELAIGAVPGSNPEIFRYSVRSDSLARAIDALAGQRVKIAYEEHRGVPTSCFGETDYFATRVEKVGG